MIPFEAETNFPVLLHAREGQDVGLNQSRVGIGEFDQDVHHHVIHDPGAGQDARDLIDVVSSRPGEDAGVIFGRCNPCGQAGSVMRRLQIQFALWAEWLRGRVARHRGARRRRRGERERRVD